MDLNALMSTMLSGDALKGIGQKTDSSAGDVMNVLSSALPAMLNGASEQASDAKTASSFVKALADHAKDSTSDLSSFSSKIDLADGAKILKHLLGNNVKSTTQAAAESAGVPEAKAGNILSGGASLLMSLLGQQVANGKDASSNNAGGIASLMTSLLSNTDVTKLLGSLIASAGSSKAEGESASPAANVLGSILGGLFKK